MSGKNDDGIDVESGFGGILKGLSNLIDAAASLAEKGDALKRTGSINFSGLDKIKGLKDIKGVYGINVRTLKDGSPSVSSFGNIRKSSKGPVVEEVREPIVDIFEEDAGIQIIAEMPGIEEQDISLEIKGDIVIINASGSKRKYQKEVLLPRTVTDRQMNWAYKNGILEININFDQK